MVLGRHTPFVILCWFAVQFERGRIEQDLAERARLCVDEEWLHLGGGGDRGPRRGGRTGRAADEDEPGKASRTAARHVGVRLVDNRVDPLERAENYIWAASRRGQRICLHGLCAELGNAPGHYRRRRGRIFPALRSSTAPALRAECRRRIPGSPASVLALRQLTPPRRGDVRLDGLNMTVTGEAEDLNEYRTGQGRAGPAVLPSGDQALANNLVAPPSVSPHTWMARLEGGQITLSGHAPDEAAASQLIALIRSTAPGLAIDNRMQPASGAPQGWRGAAAAGLRVLLSLARTAAPN